MDPIGTRLREFPDHTKDIILQLVLTKARRLNVAITLPVQFCHQFMKTQWEVMVHKYIVISNK